MSDLMFFGMIVGTSAIVVAVIGYIEILKLKLEHASRDASFNKQMWKLAEKDLKESEERILEILR